MDSDSELLLRLRSGDERAFVSLVERYHEPMLRLAASFVPSRAVAEEVVQDTWLAVLRGLENFEGRSSLKTWLFRILVNRARSTGSKEQRTVPVADPEPAVDPSRFGGDGGWADPPEHWIEAAESRMEAGKLADRIRGGRRAARHARWCCATWSGWRRCADLRTAGWPRSSASSLREVRAAVRTHLVSQQAVELDQPLGLEGGRARRRFEAHLAACPHCTEYLAQMRETISLTGRSNPRT